jgi:hypothetical protein
MHGHIFFLAVINIFVVQDTRLAFVHQYPFRGIDRYTKTKNSLNQVVYALRKELCICYVTIELLMNES